MADVVRISSAQGWTYVPVGSPWARFASSEGLTMFSEGGPFQDADPGVVPDVREGLKTALGNLKDGSLGLGCGRLCFGHREGAYNPFLDLTLMEQPGGSVRLSGKDLQDGDITIVVLGDGTVSPGRYRQRTGLDLPWSIKAGQRAFVLDEAGEGLLSVSRGSKGTDRLRIFPKQSLSSWMSAINPDMESERFSVEASVDGTFTVKDQETGKRYRGRLLHPEDPKEIKSLLSREGLAGLVERYQLNNEVKDG